MAPVISCFHGKSEKKKDEKSFGSDWAEVSLFLSQSNQAPSFPICFLSPWKLRLIDLHFLPLQAK